MILKIFNHKASLFTFYFLPFTFFFFLCSCSSPPAAPVVVNFKVGVVSAGDPIPALPGVKTSKVRLNNVVRNAVEARQGEPLTLKLSGRVRLAVGAIHGDAKIITFTIAGGDKSEKLTVTPNQGWAELDLTFPAGVDGITITSDAPAGAYVATPRAVNPGPHRLAALFVIDALRADALGVSGAPGNPSPNLDAFAKRAAVFTRAHTASSFTLTSVASILTGLWPWQHGVIFEGDAGLALSPAVPTLVEKFRAAGWHTAAFSGTYFSFADNGFARGFDMMDESCADKFFSGSADCLAGRVRAFLAEHADEPVFIYVHFVDPHSPYHPPEPFRSRFTAGLPKPKDEDTAAGDQGQFEETQKVWQFLRRPSAGDLAWLRGLYQGEVAYVDDRLGPVLNDLAGRCQAPPGQYFSCSVVITADHGETFNEHGIMGHTAELHEPVMRVPFIVHHSEPDFPFEPASRYHDEVRTIDALPILLSLSRIEPPADIPGRSLHGSMFYTDRILHQTAVGVHFIRGKKEYAVVMWPWKLFYMPEKKRIRLFKLDVDAGETVDLAGREPDKVRELMTELDRQLSLPAPGKAGAPTDPDTLRRLRDLGYINK